MAGHVNAASGTKGQRHGAEVMKALVAGETEGGRELRTVVVFERPEGLVDKAISVRMVDAN